MKESWLDTEGQFELVSGKCASLKMVNCPKVSSSYLSPVDADCEQGEDVEGHRHVAHVVVNLAVHRAKNPDPGMMNASLSQDQGGNNRICIFEKF